MNRRHENAADDFIHDRTSDQRSRAIRPHTASVGASVVIEGSLVILSDIKRHNGVAVNNSQNAGFLPDKAFFDDNLRTSLTKRPILQDRLNGRSRFTFVRTNKHTLASCKSVGFDDQRLFLTFFQILHRFGHATEDGKARGRDAGFPEQLLCEDLTAFQPSRSGRWAEDCQVLPSELICQSGDEWRFRTDYGQVDVVVPNKTDEAAHVFGRYVQVFGIDGCAGVSWSAVNLFDKRRVAQLPNQGVLSPARTDDKDLHGNVLSR